MKAIENLFKILGDENRLRILLMLNVRPLCVCEINEVLDIALSTISQHLKLMKSSGYITDHKEGRWVIYSMNSENDLVKRVMGFLEKELIDDERFMRDRSKIASITREFCSAKLSKK
ncbi:MAG: winged helix-turn-helix transcriptional regulator [Spirochaetota bacterium]|nr:MAG: winged helix-turn-helix transcriptional regulator [Spirochaetota bacterium]